MSAVAKRTRVVPKALDCIANQKITIVNDVFGSPYHMISEEMLPYAKAGAGVRHSDADVATRTTTPRAARSNGTTTSPSRSWSRSSAPDGAGTPSNAAAWSCIR